MARGPFRRTRSGFDVLLSDVEAAALRRIGKEMVRVLTDEIDQPQLRRLFPPAYEDDPKKQAEFQEFTRDELTQRKRASARALIEVIDRGRSRRGAWTASLSNEEAAEWLGAFNDARLVLGERLGVTEDMDPEPLRSDDPAAAAHNMYVYLSGLQWQLIEELSDADGFGPADAGFE